MDNVVEFPSKESGPYSADDILKNAQDHNAELKSVFIVGEFSNGGTYFATNIEDAGTLLWLMEQMKYHLIFENK